MKINVLKKTKNELRFEIEGEGHTFCNLLQHALLEDKSVEMAGYNIPHPLVGKTIFQVKIKEGRSPERALLRALERIGQNSNEFLEEFEKAIG
ncbi:DNA-directed RNA polymerase subunit L [Candidatus Bathyarchaeota archaeon]|nr:DNA-directed RNA polymerase subunit L [Candidatus Bathyarchaeota archaeon]